MMPLPDQNPLTDQDELTEGDLDTGTGRPPWLLPLLIVISAAILMAPRPDGMSPAAHRLLAVAALMAGLWITQAIPLAVTSLLPLALFPLLGILPAEETSKAFVEDSLFLYIGGMILALGIERWQLHRRIALNVVALVGVSPKRMVAGFSIATFGLSMWISNTACTMLMLPIGLALLRILSESDTADGRRRSDQLAAPLLLSLAYSATLGGMATPVGSPTNSVAIGIFEKQYPGSRVYFSEWLLACSPIALVYLAAAWFLLTRSLPGRSAGDQVLRLALRDRLASLGAMTTAEIRMLFAFALTALLWVTRERMKIGDVTICPGWIHGYAAIAGWLTGSAADGAALTGKGVVSDATISILMASLLFFIPSGSRDAAGRRQPLMDWRTANRLPWDMILLFGGGFALAAGFKSTRLAEWLGAALQGPLENSPSWLVVAVVCLCLILLTELTSNVATVSAVLPTLLAMAEPLHLDPRMLFMPATLAASAGFMLPVGTPPNAIVFSTGRISSTEMARRGLILNLLGVPILTLGNWLLIGPLTGQQ